MSGGQSAGCLEANANNLASRPLLLFLQPLLQSISLDELHHEIWKAIDARLFHLVNCNDIFVRDRGGSSGFAAKSLTSRGVICQFGIEHLDSHMPLQARVECFQHDSHSAAA